MRLYATTTSERASKGQGGNEYLDIVINQDRINVCRIYLNGGDVDILRYSDGKRFKLHELKGDGQRCEHGLSVCIDCDHPTKGKKQKSEKGEYNICESFGCGNATEEPDGEYCAFH